MPVGRAPADSVAYLQTKLVLYDPPYGPLTQLWAGTAPEAAALNGKVRLPRHSCTFRR